MLTYPDFLKDDQLDQAYELIKEIDKFITDHDPLLITLAPMVPSLVEVARRLRVFACQQLNFFRNTMLEIPAEYPREYIYALIHDQVARDFAVIREAVCQRQNGSPQMIATLNVADHFGQDVLKDIKNKQIDKYFQDWSGFTSRFPPENEMPAIEILKSYLEKNNEQKEPEPPPKKDNFIPKLSPVTGEKINVYPDETIVITYFRKFPALRLIPYAPVALIGIPFTSVTRRQDLLATSHEIGHQVFWRNKQLRAAIQDNKPRSSTPPEDCAYSWAEEIFADTFGVQMTGPATALFAQELEAGFDFAHFKQEDGAHPVSLLRPYIHTKALYHPSKKVTQELVSLWNYYRTRRAFRTNYILFFKDKSGRPIRINNVVFNKNTNYSLMNYKLPVDFLVNLSRNHLRSLVGPVTPWWTLNSLDISADDLYTKFCDYLDLLPITPIAELAQDPAIGTLCTQTADTVSCADPTWANVVRDYLSVSPDDLINGRAVSPTDWLPLMSMDAWADKGPTSNPRGD